MEKEIGLGIGKVERLRPFSFQFQDQQTQQIRRKPLPWKSDALGTNRMSAIGMAVPLDGPVSK